MLQPLLYLFAADRALGRFDVSLLSDQTCMEMLVDGMKDLDKSLTSILDDKGNYRDVSDWRMTDITNLIRRVDVVLKAERVEKIWIERMKYTDAQFPFCFIPPLVSLFTARSCDLHGTLDTAELPKDLLEFYVDTNSLHGPINFKAFPRELQRVDLISNCFSGSCALSDLPSSLRCFAASRNRFDGQLSLDDLPEALEELSLARNKLTGSIDIVRLPQGMRTINLGGNRFSGDLRLLALPPSLLEVRVTERRQKDDALSGTAVLLGVDRDCSMHFEMFYSSVATVLDEKGKTHAWQGKIVESNVNADASDDDYWSSW